MVGMSTKDETKRILREHGLRVTGPRLAVYEVLSEAEQPMSHGDVLAALGPTDWDPATIYRNLVKLRDAGIAPVVSRLEGIDRYALATEGGGHQHPHFVCQDCGRVECLPESLALTMRGRWRKSIEHASIQLRGECPDCRNS